MEHGGIVKMDWKKIPELVESYEALTRGENKHVLLMMPTGFGRIEIDLPDGAERFGYTTLRALTGDYNGGIRKRGLLEWNKILFFEEFHLVDLSTARGELCGILRNKNVGLTSSTGTIFYTPSSTIWAVVRPRYLYPEEEGVFTAVDLPKYLDRPESRDLDKTPRRIKDSGSRQEFNTGAVRDIQQGKGRYDLIPWEVITLLARHFEEGARKYGERNWERGIPLCRYFDSAIRHLVQYKLEMDDEPHLVASIWNLICLLQTELWIQRGILPEELGWHEGDNKD